MLKSLEIFYPPHRKGSLIDGVSDTFSSETRGAVSASPFTFQIPLLTPPGLRYGVLVCFFLFPIPRMISLSLYLGFYFSEET